MFDWLSRQWHQGDAKKDNFTPVEHRPEIGLHEADLAAEYAAARQRIEFVKDHNFCKLSALCCEQVFAGRKKSKALQEQIDRYWAILSVIGEHRAKLAMGASRGHSIEFDTIFWREHTQLLEELPMEMRPKKLAMIPAGCKEHAAGLRKRENGSKRQKHCPA